MASLAPVAPEISAVIQIQNAHPNATALQSLQDWKATSSKAQQNDNTASTLDNKKAEDAAKQFEALLIHNMIKSMRKNTLSEGKSNQRAMYDDMLDQQIATAMVESGGIGVAESLLPQLIGQDSQKPSNNLVIGSPQGSTKPENNQPTHSRLVPQLGLSAFDVQQLRQSAQQEPIENDDLFAYKQQEFLDSLRPHAEQAAEKLGVNSNVVLAIAALETGWGKHMLKDAEGFSTHNYFGIKAQKNDTAYSNNTTTEFIGNIPRTVNDRFKAFGNASEGFEGFAQFLLDNPRYKNALAEAAEPKQFIKELHKAGYATDPHYAKKAITVLEQIERRFTSL